MRQLALVISLAIVLAAAGRSAATAQQPQPTLRVYTKPIEPFAFKTPTGRATGFSIELWDRIARELNVRYELHWGRTVGDLIDALEHGQADVAVAAISITSERESRVEFSTPFYESGLSILVNTESKSGLGSILASFVSPELFKMGLVLFGLLVIAAHLIWLFERKRNPEQFPAPYLRGVWESAWWAISTILSGGCDAKGPVVVGGRIVGALWMFVCIIVITYFTAAITTIMTVNSLTSDIEGPRDLPGQPVATVRGSTAERYLRDHRARVHAFTTIDEAYAALNARRVKAVVYDAPILLYHQNQGASGRQAVVGRLFERQNYGIGLQRDSPYRKQINRVLLSLREDGFLDELHTKWFGAED